MSGIVLVSVIIRVMSRVLWVSFFSYINGSTER